MDIAESNGLGRRCRARLCPRMVISADYDGESLLSGRSELNYQKFFIRSLAQLPVANCVMCERRAKRVEIVGAKFHPMELLGNVNRKMQVSGAAITQCRDTMHGQPTDDDITFPNSA